MLEALLSVNAENDSIQYCYVNHFAFVLSNFSSFPMKIKSFERPHGKTNNLHRRKQSRRSAWR